jgi:hypothetical protein
MAKNTQLTNLAVNTEADALAALCNGGFMDIYDGTQPATGDTAITTQNKLASCALNATAFGAAVAGVLTANAARRCCRRKCRGATSSSSSCRAGRARRRRSLLQRLREPFIYGDITAVTLASTAKALYPAANFPVLGGQYFTRIGKALRIRLFGRMTTGATPGNGSFNVYYGTGADANGTAIMTGTPVALVANGTNLSWMVEVDVHARTLGAAGTLFCTGFAHCSTSACCSRRSRRCCCRPRRRRLPARST